MVRLLIRLFLGCFGGVRSSFAYFYKCSCSCSEPTIEHDKLNSNDIALPWPGKPVKGKAMLWGRLPRLTPAWWFQIWQSCSASPLIVSGLLVDQTYLARWGIDIES